MPDSKWLTQYPWRQASEAGTEGAPGWRWLACFALVLVLIGVSDFTLAWFPPMFGNAQWEFGTIAATFQGLPLIAIGLVALLAAGFALRLRWMILATGVVLLAGAAILMAASAMFLKDVPLALGATQGAAGLVVRKAIAKTVLAGGAFTATFLVAGYVALRSVVRGTMRRPIEQRSQAAEPAD